MRDSSALRDLAVAVVEAFNRSDVPAIVDGFLDGESVFVIGQHAVDWAEGKEAIAALFGAELGLFRMAVDELRAWERGEVGWFVGRLRYLSHRFEEGELSTRVTGVAVRKGSEWKLVLVHSHLVSED